MPRPVEIGAATAAADIAAVKALFLEYAESLDFDLCFQGFDEEMETFPGRYGPPQGVLLLAKVDGQAAGAVGLRPLSDGICEMKRLYVQPAFRAHKAGRRLAEAILDAGAALGYRAMRLDTIDSMQAAQALYRSLGFFEIPPYYDSPIPGVRYFECALGSRRANTPLDDARPAN